MHRVIRIVIFYKKNTKKWFLFNNWRKKLATPLFICQNFGKPPLSISKKFEIPPKILCPPHPNPPAVYIMNAALMEVQLYTEWDDNHVCIINQWKGGEVILHDGYYRWKNFPMIWKIIDNTALLNKYTLTKVSWRLTTIYLPTFSGSNAWDFRLAMIAWFENVPASSEDFR